MTGMLKLFMPVSKTSDGRFMAILSDNSIDRDGEIIGKEVLTDWANNKSLNALANHKNSMETWVGSWKNFRVVENGDHSALVAEPTFFSAKANPLAEQIKQQVTEALEQGMIPGVSIGAIPHETKTKEINGKNHTVYTSAELVEASWTPVPANKHAVAFRSLAKQFNLIGDFDVSKKANEVIVVADKTEEKTFTQKELDEAIVKAVAEKVAELNKAKESSEKKDVTGTAEISTLKTELESMKKAVADLTEKAVNLQKGAIEAPLDKNAEVKAPTIETMLKAKYGITA